MRNRYIFIEAINLIVLHKILQMKMPKEVYIGGRKPKY